MIKWKVNGAPTTEQVEAELTAATEAVTSGSAPETGAEPAVTSDSEPATADTTRTEPESAEAEDPFPAGTWVKVRKGKRKAIVGQVTQRIGSNTWRVHEFGKPESWTQLATAAQLSCAEEPAPEAPKPARRSRRSTTITPVKLSRSQYAINADMIAAGKVPEKPPVVTSKANPHYQKRFDTRIPRRHRELGNFGQLGARSVVKRAIERWELPVRRWRRMCSLCHALSS